MDVVQDSLAVRLVVAHGAQHSLGQSKINAVVGALQQFRRLVRFRKSGQLRIIVGIVLPRVVGW